MRTGKLVITLVVVASIARIALASAIPLFPDETYYWDWSRHLAGGYFDHPPAIALLIRAGTTILGVTPLGVRIGAILASAIASLALVVTSWRLGAESSARGADVSHTLDDPGVRVALFMLVIPAALLGFVIATPDAPLMAAIALTLASLERAVASPLRSRASLGWWCAAGVTLGIAFCSKYTSVLLPTGVFVALLARRDLRARFAEPGPYAATLIALLVLTPTLLWNSNHNWISFAFQLQHGLSPTHGSVIGREFSLIGGQLGLISPIIAVLAAIAVARALRGTEDARRFMFAVVATTFVAFFAVSALRRPVEPNWPIPALVAALPLLATIRLPGRWRMWLIAGLIFGAAGTLTIAVQAIARVVPVAARRDPTSKAYGWTDLARSVQRAKSIVHGCPAIWIAADRYQDASELAFNLPDHPRVFALNLGGRPNQYDLWTSLYSVSRPTDCALVIVDEGVGGQRVVQRIGAEHASIISDAMMLWRGSLVGRRAIWLVRGIPAAPIVEIELSPGASAALAAAMAGAQSHIALLDSIVAVYRLGPIPNAVTASVGAPASNPDRRIAIAARLASLHGLLLRSGFKAVYRDARYQECTFVRSTEPDSADIGYVYAPEGCKLAGGHGDSMLRIEHAKGAWYSYASPERRRH